MKRLSKEEIKQRLIRLRNLEYLHKKQRFKIWNLRDENRELKKKVAVLEEVVAAQQKTINDLKLQMEELRSIVFGKRKKPRDKDNNNKSGYGGENLFEEDKIPRTPDSYKRPIPIENQITKIKRHPFNTCPCGTKTTLKQILTFYEEDIPIPTEKIVIKHEVELSYCPDCKKWHKAIDLPKSKVILGKNIQKYVCYLSVMCRLSFSQIQNILLDTWQIELSQGEISKFLDREAIHLKPSYEQLKKNIRQESSAHLDETSWRLQREKENSFSWIMSGGQSKESIFLVGESRGKGNIEKLIGKDYNGVAVTDDYGAYKKFENHQLCWAHLIRKFRDLANSQELNEAQIAHCQKEYHKLCLIYSDIKNNRTIEKYSEFEKQLNDFSKIKPKDKDILKTIRLKTTLKKNVPKYLTCLKNPNIAMTNNQAERSLRHLVLKRKISFGSFAKRTADNLAVLLSIMASFKQRYQSNFFTEYLKA